MTSHRTTQVAVVGGGPAGVAAAIELRAGGVAEVILIERESSLGGASRHCGHPTYGLREFGRLYTGPDYARRLQREATAAGVDVRLGATVVALEAGGGMRLANTDGAFHLQAKRVVLATGARETPRSARLISGQRPAGVMNTGALQSHVYVERLTPFRRPLLVGTELVGLSAVWTCLAHGMRPAAVVEAGDRFTARWPARLLPSALGIPVRLRSRIVDIVGRSTLEAVEIEDTQGRRERIACDGVVFSGEFLPETALMRGGFLALDPSGGLAVDQYGRCSDPVYFAAGNVLRGIETAAWCHGEGRTVARTVVQDLAGRLPLAARAAPVIPGRGIKLTSPQKIAFPFELESGACIQLRASERIAGRLTVRADDREVWSRPVRLLPERRYSVPLPSPAILWHCRVVSIEVQ